eukprot:TRINITY_DN142_c4_g1_i1.p1 TRINITY_DN142_c4_g1~~TRINITY_DN142_c4_g1_i1.p1  ORF type:complete len:524 (+),score=163.72 TRINITY_DN142_c4_g1_i1:202-1572(+)
MGISNKIKDKLAEDFTARVDEELPKHQAVAKGGNLVLAIDNLLALEKVTRNGGDNTSTNRIACAIVVLCYEAGDFTQLFGNLTLLSKRRGQSKMVVKGIVNEAMSLDILAADAALDANRMEKRMELITTLRTITAGKIHVENERAKLTSILSGIWEKEGKVKEACDVMLEIQVETFGSMEKLDKVDFILDQMRLCLVTRELVVASILEKKINRKLLLSEGFEARKLQFYRQLIEMYTHEDRYLDICQCYQKIYDTPCIQEDPIQWKEALRRVVVFVALSPHDNMQSDLLFKIALDKKLIELPKYKGLLKYFATLEIMRWPFIENLWRSELETLKEFTGEGGEKLWKALHGRVIEHNIRVIAGYYSRITFPRLTELLDLDQTETEKRLSELVVSKSVYAKIDRPAGVVVFNKKQDPNEILNDWHSNVATLLDTVERTCHHIQREQMMADAAKKNVRR